MKKVDFLGGPPPPPPPSVIPLPPQESQLYSPTQVVDTALLQLAHLEQTIKIITNINMNLFS